MSADMSANMSADMSKRCVAAPHAVPQSLFPSITASHSICSGSTARLAPLTVLAPFRRSC